mmetsp:Transcript_25275/g.100734  ORF Transcript_25275/g.100734 Transcript_25275/m.100734 type:complete len:203 (-) Transcript_25275:221-829(-)
MRIVPSMPVSLHRSPAAPGKSRAAPTSASLTLTSSEHSDVEAGLAASQSRRRRGWTSQKAQGRTSRWMTWCAWSQRKACAACKARRTARSGGLDTPTVLLHAASSVRPPQAAASTATASAGRAVSATDTSTSRTTLWSSADAESVARIAISRYTDAGRVVRFGNLRKTAASPLVLSERYTRYAVVSRRSSPPGWSRRVLCEA